jgi:hypothetical protein
MLIENKSSNPIPRQHISPADKKHRSCALTQLGWHRFATTASHAAQQQLEHHLNDINIIMVEYRFDNSKCKFVQYSWTNSWNLNFLKFSSYFCAPIWKGLSSTKVHLTTPEHPCSVPSNLITKLGSSNFLKKAPIQGIQTYHYGSYKSWKVPTHAVSYCFVVNWSMFWSYQYTGCARAVCNFSEAE